MITFKPAPADPRHASFAEFDRMQRAKNCVLLHDEAGYGVIREDIRLAGEAYRPQADDIPAMLRVINAKKALRLYAETHPNVDMVLRVEGDADIPMNNAYYVLKDGKVRQTDEPCLSAVKLSIDALARFIFNGEGAEMNLMLN